MIRPARSLDFGPPSLDRWPPVDTTAPVREALPFPAGRLAAGNSPGGVKGLTR
jgi:hypothetical protein